MRYPSVRQVEELQRERAELQTALEGAEGACAGLKAALQEAGAEAVKVERRAEEEAEGLKAELSQVGLEGPLRVVTVASSRVAFRTAP
eukprot:4382073-Pyramimonas_sp.AAC.1